MTTRPATVWQSGGLSIRRRLHRRRLRLRALHLEQACSRRGGRKILPMRSAMSRIVPRPRPIRKTTVSYRRCARRRDGIQRCPGDQRLGQLETGVTQVPPTECRIDNADLRCAYYTSAGQSMLRLIYRLYLSIKAERYYWTPCVLNLILVCRQGTPAFCQLFNQGFRGG
jgi:hypothetical protein